MKATRVKNRTAFGAKMRKMDGDTYRLRRNVIDIIYDLKKVVDLPRVEVRIVDLNNEVCGYGYYGRNVIHIGAKYAKLGGDALYHIVLHEIVHAVTSFKHDENCHLMQSVIPLGKFDNDKALKSFLKYF